MISFSRRAWLGAIAMCAMTPLARAAPADDALTRLLTAMVPAADDLPGGAAVVDQVARMLAPTTLAPILSEVRRMPLVDDAALAKLVTMQPTAMRALAQATFSLLYGSKRHGGIGEQRAFLTLGFP